jgi:hypothetical protein
MFQIRVVNQSTWVDYRSTTTQVNYTTTDELALRFETRQEAETFLLITRQVTERVYIEEYKGGE